MIGKIVKVHLFRAAKSKRNQGGEPEHYFGIDALAMRRLPLTHSHSFASLARTARTIESKSKSKSISQFAGGGQAVLTPPNLRYSGVEWSGEEERERESQRELEQRSKIENQKCPNDWVQKISRA